MMQKVQLFIMDAFLIEGKRTLHGEVTVSGSKNATLPLLFSSLLFKSEQKYRNVPDLWDVQTTLKMLEFLGANIHWNKAQKELSIIPSIHQRVAPYELVKKMRASILVLGPLLARFGEASVSLPGGCAIGVRPVDYHLDAMKKMGVLIDLDAGYIRARVPKSLTGGMISFPKPTVTGTENILMLATHADRPTYIENAACEPEVMTLGQMLIDHGANIQGLGTSSITVIPTALVELTPPTEIPYDRIEAGTWIAIASSTHSELVIHGVPLQEMKSTADVFAQIGVGIKVLDAHNNICSVLVTPQERYAPAHVITAPYPGFPTDMQAQLMTVLCLAEGISVIEESIFENRLMHVAELERLGASIHLKGHVAMITGPCRLKGAPVMATDLRASASLVIAGLCAEGETKISRIYHLDRGYEKLDKKLQSVGAKMIRMTDQ